MKETVRVNVKAQIMVNMYNAKENKHTNTIMKKSKTNNNTTLVAMTGGKRGSRG